MTVEGRLQTNIRVYLKSKGCYVMVIKPQPGIPDGAPDIFFFLEGFWGCIEVKDSPRADYQPLQKETLNKLGQWSFARRVDPTNWFDVKLELENLL